MLALAATLALSASVANALSSGCTSTLTSIALGTGGDCLNIAGLVPLVTLSSTESVIPSVDSWLTGLCSAVNSETCNNSTLQALGTNITNACGSDLTSLGLPSSIVSQIPDLLQQYYTVGGEALCTRNKNNSDAHCITSELTLLQNSLGTNLTTSNAISSAVGVLSNTTLEDALACTTCVQGIYAILRPELGSSLTGSIDEELNGLCGSGFVTTTEPTQIVVATGSLATATSTSTSKPNSASLLHPLSSMSLAPAVLASLGGAFLLGSGSVLIGA